MFKFGNFDGNDKDENIEDNGEEILPAKEIRLNTCISSPKNKTCSIIVNDIEIQYFDPTQILQIVSIVDSIIKVAEKNHSDLIEGIYEGGLKIWECTYDVANYLCNENRALLKEKRVLDLGCGSGILGILAYKLGATEVHFQDYNEGVIKHLTMPNVVINDVQLLENSKFWCGDWKSFNIVNMEKYDVILTSETIYNPKSHKKLLMVFKTFLKPNGIIILGGKSYYFGVGGGMKQLEDLIEKDNTLCYENVWSSEIGIKREIIEIRFK